MGMFDTPLTPEDEARFQTWRGALPPNLQSDQDYDLRGAWRGAASEAANGHLPDSWKKPNHMTFSDESIYASPQRPGGHWSENPDQTWTYAAPPDFTRYRSPDDLLNYFQAFEANKSVDPSGRISYGKPNRVRLPGR